LQCKAPCILSIHCWYITGNEDAKETRSQKRHFQKRTLLNDLHFIYGRRGCRGAFAAALYNPEMHPALQCHDWLQYSAPANGGICPSALCSGESDDHK
jgi:hypothetical protein